MISDDGKPAFEYSDKGLSAILKALAEVAPKARVGILGNKNQRNNGQANSNATIGLKHEFGKDDLPIRSFLRVPIIENLKIYLERAGAFDKEAAKEVVKQKSFAPWVAKLGIIAESIVADAFSTGGFGKWKPSNMAFKKNHQTLIESQQLRNSITSEVR